MSLAEMLKWRMRYVYSTLSFLLFIAVLGFAVKNSESVTLSYYLGLSWQAPLSLMLLIVLALGALLGLLAGLPLVIRERRRRIQIEKELRTLQPK